MQCRQPHSHISKQIDIKVDVLDHFNNKSRTYLSSKKKENPPCMTSTKFVSFVRKCGNNQSKSHMKDDSNADLRFGASISSEKVMSRPVRACEEIQVRFMIPFGYWRVA